MKKTLMCLLVLISFTSTIVVEKLDAQELNKKDKRIMIDSISHQLINGYIYEDKGKEIASLLKESFKKGEFKKIVSKDEFAKVITDKLFELSNDKHLYVRLNKAESTQNRRVVRRRVVSDDDNNSGNAVERRRVSRGGVPNVNNYGFDRVEVLPNNIGYLKFSMFALEPEALKKADAAMTFLSDVDALIIDLRRNLGGSPDMVLYLSSYFFENPAHLSTSYRRGWEAPVERWTKKEISGKVLKDIPIYVLTSKRTFSAAESFTFGLKNNDRIIIVGENTGGGGHFGEMVSLGKDFTMFLPQGKVWNPKTGKGFQSTGISPDYKVAADDALDKAIQLINDKK